MAYGNKAPKQWHRCPSEQCREPLHANEHCPACGLLAVELDEVK